jgi:hypothetical protein
MNHKLFQRNLVERKKKRKFGTTVMRIDWFSPEKKKDQFTVPLYLTPFHLLNLPFIQSSVQFNLK